MAQNATGTSQLRSAEQFLYINTAVFQQSFLIECFDATGKSVNLKHVMWQGSQWPPSIQHWNIKSAPVKIILAAGKQGKALIMFLYSAAFDIIVLLNLLKAQVMALFPCQTRS